MQIYLRENTIKEHESFLFEYYDNMPVVLYKLHVFQCMIYELNGQRIIEVSTLKVLTRL